MAIYLIDKVKQKNDGKFFLMDAIDVEYNGKSLVEALAAGDVEVNGADGGTNWYVGTTAPDAEVVAKEGDFYLNTTTYDLYKQGASDWELVGSIKGADGEKGDKGDPGEKGEKGDTGAPFTIAKVYASVEAMNAGYATDGVAIGSFVAIDTGSVEDEDNAKLYLKGDSAYTYITDMSGATGLQGPTGDKGDTGEKGDKGVSLRVKGAWVASTEYVNNDQYIDLVTNGGNTYAAVDTHTSGAAFADDTAHWTLVAEKGAKGDQGEKGETGEAGADGNDGIDGEKGDTGVSMRLKGSWATGTSYVNDAQYIDVVVQNGATYACVTSHTATTFEDDAANWLMIAAKGEAGADGAQGAKGDKGDPFSIAKIYDSVANMNAGYATDDVPVGGFVLIETGNVEDADNAKLYVKGDTAYVFLTDMSGATGLQGPAGADGNDGEKGDTGVSMRLMGEWATGTSYVNDASYIDVVTYNGNTYAAKDSHTAGTTFDEDAAHWTMIAAKGAQGDQGIQGVTPTIGENGNWFIGEEDTGKPSRGDGVEEGITDRVETLEEQVAQLLYVAPAINSFTNNVGTKEKGATVTSVTFNWTLNKKMTKVEFNGVEEAGAADSTTGTKTLTGQTITSDTSYTLKVTDEKNATAQKTTSIVFRNGLYTGVSSVTEDAQINSAFVQGMTKALTNTRVKTFTVTAGEGEYIYYIIPTSFGTPAFKVGGFEGGFNKVKTFDYQNVEGYTESYDVWRSTNANLGNTTVVVS